MIGGLIRDIKPSKHYLFALIILLFFANVLLQYSLIPFVHTKASSIYYASPITIGLAAIILMKSLSHKFSKDNLLIRELSKLFLLVFSLHSFFIPMGIKVASISGSFAPGVCWIFVSLITVIVSWLIMRIPICAKLLKI